MPEAQAQAVAKRAINNVANVPINSLPAEILTHIFHLVLTQQPCLLRMTEHWNSWSPVHVPRYPDTLSHVCSQWREVALASHVLWSHIDIVLSCPLSKGFHDRAATYVTRAYEAPLDIHFIDPDHIRQRSTYYYDLEQGFSDGDGSSDEKNEWNNLIFNSNPEEFTFLASSTGPRIRSLGLLVRYKYHPIHSRALEHCLANCLPKGLAELVINIPNHALSSSRFVEASPDPQNRQRRSGTRLLLPEQRLESAWHSTTSLMLRGRYPRWTSEAFCKLTDLRLLGRMRISGPELAGIVRASPGLRILRCDFEISNSPRLDASTFSISLQELETLNLRGMAEVDLDYFLRWLSPGSKPLRLSLHGNPTYPLLKDFFGRSNVKEMHIEARSHILGTIQLPCTMFYLPPHLRALVVVGWGYITHYKIMERLAELGLLNNAPPLMEVDTMYLLTCRYHDFRQFQEMVEKYSPREIIIWSCEIGTSEINLPLLESAFGNNLPQICPSIKCLTVEDPNPIHEWNPDSDWD